MIPDWLREKLAHPPVSGTGLHAWLFSVARQLHAHMPPAAVGAALAAATAGADRVVTEREIRDAVNNSHAVRWTRRAPGLSDVAPDASGRPDRMAVRRHVAESRWPSLDANLRDCVVSEARANGVCGHADLHGMVGGAEWEDWTADDWLDVLFPSAEWLCLAKDHPATARTRRREKWSWGPADDCGLIVPAPMTGPSGRGLDGRVSHRCLANTGPRRWLVIEFDAGSREEQVGLHWSLREVAVAMKWPLLCLMLSSGGKSVHGWYGPVESEEQARALMEFAVLLGADPATWNRCQLVRLPAGRRGEAPVADYELPDGWERPETVTVRQSVYFFDPILCNHTNLKFIKFGALSGSMPHGSPGLRV